jgi:hypothetical protein
MRLKDFLRDDSGLIFVPIILGLFLGGVAATGVEVTGNALNANDYNNAAQAAHETKNAIKVHSANLTPEQAARADKIVNDLQVVETANREDFKDEVFSGVKTVGKDVLLSVVPGGKVGGTVLKAAAKQSNTVRKAINLAVKVAPLGSKGKEALALKEAVGTVVLKSTGAEKGLEITTNLGLTAVEKLIRGEKNVAAPAGSPLEDAIITAKMDAATRMLQQATGKADPAAVRDLAAQVVVDAERDKKRIEAASDPKQDGAAGANALSKLWGKAKDEYGNPFLQRLQEALKKLQPDPGSGSTEAARAGVSPADIAAVKDGSAGAAIGVVWENGASRPAIVVKGAKGLEVIDPLNPGAPAVPLKDDLTLDVPSFAGTWSGTYGLRVDVPGYGSAVTPIPMSFTVNPDGTAVGNLSYNGPVKCPGLPAGASVTYKMSGKMSGKVTGDKLVASGPWSATATIHVAGFSKSTPGNATVNITGTFAGNTFTGSDQRKQKISATRK